MSASQILDKIPFIVFYLLLVGNVLTVGQVIIHGLRQIGGFPSSHQEMLRMSERVNKEEISEMYSKCRKRMIILWISALVIITLSSIASYMIR